MGVFRDRCVGGGWICGLETKAEVGTRDTNLRVIYTEMRAEALGRDKAAKEGSLDKEERPETDSYEMCVCFRGERGRRHKLSEHQEQYYMWQNATENSGAENFGKRRGKVT